MADAAVSLDYIENIRTTPAETLGFLIGDVLRKTIDRIDPECAADLFALSEVKLPVGLGEDVRNWVLRARKDIADMPEGDGMQVFLAAVADIPAQRVPAPMREAVLATRARASAETAAFLDELAADWEATPPKALVLPAKKVVKAAAVTAGGDPIKKKVAGAPRTSSPKTPAAQVDPRRAEWVREDVIARLQPYERGLKDSILVSTTVHRSPYKDLTEAEVRAELRKLERERKLKHSGDRWMMR